MVPNAFNVLNFRETLGMIYRPCSTHVKRLHNINPWDPEITAFVDR